ncbi:MAG: hypothetical protein ABW043_17055 [Devosia sp.]|uniref:hypothetical protein n=1 Tax=Devosia sp. TaxID=1871048 RepID=UPI00339508D3
MTTLTGEGKPDADLGVLKPIDTAPKTGLIFGAWVSITGKLMLEEPIHWFQGTSDGFDPDDCPVNICDWAGWAGDSGHIVFPSHWREADDWEKGVVEE